MIRCGHNQAQGRGSKAMKRHLTDAALLFSAAACFLTGIAGGTGSVVGATLIVVAAVSEFTFWRRVRRPARS